MTAIGRIAGNMAGPKRSIVFTMGSVLAALLLSASVLADPGATGDPVPAAAAPPPAEAMPPAKPAANAQILPFDQRLEAYDQFRAMYETARFADALPLALRVVELSETDRDRDIELPIAYNNLGATQFQLGDHAAAETSYKKSLELLEATQGISSPRLVVPLSGLGAVYAALDQHQLAVVHLDRALAVSRRSEGLFNLKQLPLIEQAAASRFTLTDYAGVERDRLYALRIAEQHYGFDDPRTLPALLELASFYESLTEFVAARGIYLRIRDISMKESGGFNPLAIKSLVGIARTHRMQYTMEPESLEGQGPARDDVTGEVVGRVYRESRVPSPAADRTGLKSAQTALGLLRATPDPPPQLLAETLIELGDWYQATSRPDTAKPYYAEAASLYPATPEPGPVNPFLAPRMIFYRAPIASERHIGTPSDRVAVRRTLFSFVVTEAGRVSDVAVVDSDMTEVQLAQSRRALERAIYSPRFENGRAVATEGVRFPTVWYEQQAPAPAPAPAPAVPSAPGT